MAHDRAAAKRREAVTGLLADGGAVVETAEVVGITDPDGMAVPVATGFVLAAWAFHLRYLAKASKPAKVRAAPRHRPNYR